MLDAPRWRVASGIVLAGLAAWFAIPAFSAGYTEGFQAQIVLASHALQRGDVLLADTLFPFDARFFLLTRLGTALGLAGMRELGVGSGLAAFRIAGVLSLILLVGALLLLLRRRGVGWRLGLLCCLLFPPIFESAWLPNDDLPSAALVALAVLVFWDTPSLLRTAATGALLGAAVLLRLDAVLVGPAFAVLLLSLVPGWPARVVHACVAGVLVAGLPVLVYRLCGQSFLDVPAVTEHGLRLWDRPSRPLLNDLRTVVLNVTVLGGVAWLLGVAAFVRGRQWRDLLLAVVVPVLYAAAYRSQLVEGRYLLPLSPFVVMTMADGLRSLPGLPRPARLAAGAALGMGLLLWLVPPLPGLQGPLIADEDGPRPLLGRAWNPVPALWWQGKLRDGQAAIEAAIEQEAGGPAPIVVSGAWTSDRLVPLLLVEHGFVPRPDLVPAACRTVAEAFRRDGTTLLHLRTHTPFVPGQNEAVTWEAAGLPCVQGVRDASAPVLVVGSGRLTSPTVMLSGPGVLFSAAADRPPALAPGVVPGLSGLSVSRLPGTAVLAALGGLPAAEERRWAADTLDRRAGLLR